MSDWKSTANYWDDRYAKKQTGWERDEAHPALRNWIASGELKPCSIAIPGCGRGHEALLLAESGFDVTAIDFAEEALRKSTERLRGFESSSSVVQGDVLSYRPTIQFDAVYEQTCMCAIAPAARLQYQESLYEWLRPEAKLFALFMQTRNDSGVPPFHCDIEDMKMLFPVERWEWQSKPIEHFEHPSGVGNELAVILKRKGGTHVG